MSIAREQIWAPAPNTVRSQTTHLSYDPKSNRLAYPSGKSIFIRSLDHPTESIQYVQHNYNTTVAKFAPTGNYIASGDESGLVKIWDVIGEDLVLKGEYQILNGPINDITWDSESKRIIAVGNGKERYGHAFTWDSGNSIGEISGHSAQINAVAIRSVRPFRAATVGDDSALCFFNGPPFRFEVSARAHSNFVKDAKFSPNGEHLVSVGMDKLIVLYEGKTGEIVKKIENAHDGGILSINFLDNDEFLTASTDSSIKLWNASSGEMIQKWTALPAGAERPLEYQQVSVIGTKDHIISLSLNGDLNFFTKDSEEPVKVLQSHQKSIISSLVDKDTLYTGSYDGKIFKWDLATGSNTPATPHSNLIIGLNKIREEIVSTGWDDKLKSVSGDLQLTFDKQPKSVSSTAESISVLFEDELQVFNGDGSLILSKSFKEAAVIVASSAKYIAVGFQANKVVIFSNKGEELQTIQLRSPPSKISISPDETYLAIGDSTGKIPLYQLSDFALVHSKWGFHTGKINSISWNAESTYVVSGSLDTNVIVYSVKRPLKNLKFLNAHKDGVNFVEWWGEDKVVSGGNDSAVKLYKVAFPA